MTGAMRIDGEAFRRSVVAEYETGKIIPFLQKKVGIKGKHTIRRWIRQVRRELDA